MTATMQLRTQSGEGKTRIALSGRFDFNSHRLFRDAYEEILASGEAREIEVDMGAVDYWDSSAMGMLLLLREKTAKANKLLALVNCRSGIQQILDLGYSHSKKPEDTTVTTSLHVKTQSSEGKTRIALSGRFDFNSHRLFRDTYEDVLASGDTSEIEVDLGAVDYLDSSALGMLLLLREKSTEANKGLALTNCRGVVQQILDVANFGKLFTIR